MIADFSESLNETSNINLNVGNIGHEVSDFFGKIFNALNNEIFNYIVVLSRGCSILYEAFLLGSEQERSEKNLPVMSDSGLLSRVNDLVTNYTEQQAFPSILLVDDIAVHGRTLNLFLQCLEEQILTQFRANQNLNGNILNEKDNLRSELAKAIHIEVFAHLEEPLASLHYEYRKNCYKINPESNLSSVRELRLKAQKLANYIFESDLVNASYTLSAKLQGDTSGLVNQIKDYLTSKAGFSCEDFDRMTVLQKYIPTEHYPKAVATIRILKRNTSYWVVPYIFNADLETSAFLEMTNLFDQEFPQIQFRGQKLSETTVCSRVQCELATMMLNHLLLQDTLNGAGLSSSDYKFDKEKLIRGFGDDSYSKQFIQDFVTLAKGRASSCLPTILKFLNRSISHPLPCGGGADESLGTNETMELIQNYIYARSVNTERVLYCSDQGRLTASMVEVGRKSVCISSFLTHIHEMAAEENVVLNNRRIFTCLLYCMDRGYIATIPREVYHQKYYSHCIRVGEVSLSILPKRYEKYIPLLITMEQYCLWGWQDMEWKLDKYFAGKLNDPQLAKALWKLVESIHKSGQSLLDWAEPSDIDNENDEHIAKYKKWKRLS